MQISKLELYEVLREKMDEKSASSMVEYMETKVKTKFEQAKSIFATKEDLLRLELRITQLITESKAETQKIIANLDNKMERYNSNTIKWMFAFVFGAAVSIIGVILTVMKMGG